MFLRDDFQPPVSLFVPHLPDLMRNIIIITGFLLTAWSSAKGDQAGMTSEKPDLAYRGKDIQNI